jgi:CheY-like chemotaxis protein
MSAPLIYVVDDEEPVRGALRVLLRGSGFAVTTCSSGPEALEAMERGKPACVLTDYHMPGMDGRELIDAIRRTHPDVPVVLMTGRDESSQIERLQNVHVIAKPFDSKVLLETLRAAIAA